MATSIHHDPEELKRIGQRIIRAREQKALTQKGLADLINLPASVLSNIEKGKRLVPKLKRALFAKHLELAEEELQPSSLVAIQEVRQNLRALEKQMGIGFRSLQALPEEAKQELIAKYKELKERYEKQDGSFELHQTPSDTAAKILAKCHISSLPVDLNAIAREHSIQIGSSNSIEADGWIIYSKDQKWASIKYREGTKPGRMRFTIAHEMGHFFLQNINEEEHTCQIDGPGKPEGERQADEFASQLLMPGKLVKDLVGASVTGYEDILKISHSCEVSQQAAALRLMQVTKSCAAVVYSEAGYIKWDKASSSMHLRAKKGEAVSRTSQAARIVAHESRGLARAVETKANYWFYGRMRGKLVEHSSRLFEDKVLTLVWKK